MADELNERLIVRNFGPITNLDIEIRPLTLFIGTQGSGKSTIAKLLTICRELAHIPDGIQKRDVIFHDYGLDEYFQDDSYFSYTINGIGVKYENGQFAFPLPDERTEIKSALYVLAERNLVGSLSEAVASMWSAKIPISSLLLECMGLFERAAKMFPRYEIPFFGVDYVRRDHRNMIELRGKNKLLPLSVSSSGLQSAIPMLMVIDYALQAGDNDAFVIEEPEQNLFPENQREVLGFIASRLTAGTKRQFVITTHSPYMLSSLNVLMLAYRLYQQAEYREQAAEVVKPQLMVNPSDVAVYSLEPGGEVFCKSLISEKTGMVSVNELDTASILIGEDFNRLYDLYVKSLKGKK